MILLASSTVLHVTKGIDLDGAVPQACAAARRRFGRPAEGE